MDLERVVPELLFGELGEHTAADAIIDLVARFPAGFRQLWIDVTVRCPHALRYSVSDEKRASNT